MVNSITKMLVVEKQDKSWNTNINENWMNFFYFLAIKNDKDRKCNLLVVLILKFGYN